MFKQDRHQLRQMYHLVWQKMQHNPATLTPLELQVAAVIQQHPEYQPLLNATEEGDQDFPVELGQTNPYLHMGLHLALHEQLATDRPAGIRDCYHQLCQRSDSAHQAEHLMIDCLAESLWQAQRQQQLPDQAAYLLNLQNLLNQG